MQRYHHIPYIRTHVAGHVVLDRLQHSTVVCSCCLRSHSRVEMTHADFGVFYQRAQSFLHGRSTCAVFVPRVFFSYPFRKITFFVVPCTLQSMQSCVRVDSSAPALLWITRMPHIFQSILVFAYIYPFACPIQLPLLPGSVVTSRNSTLSLRGTPVVFLYVCCIVLSVPLQLV